jgi:Zn-dependent protease with chaperone function
MDKTYAAIYYDSAGRFYNATIFLSSITLSIRYTDENNQLKDVYWLAENIISLEEEALVSVLNYKNNQAQIQRLVIRDLELLKAIKKQFSHYRFAEGWKHHLLSNTRNKLLLVFGMLICLILLAYFVLMPWIGERIARNISKQWEIRMGEQMHQSLMGQFSIDSSKTILINKFFRELGYNISYPVNITVVNSKEINAFAIPGGHIIIYSSILNTMRRHEELAALLSHEASHIELRHSLRNIFRSLARKMFLMMLFGSESGFAGIIVHNADNLKGLEYSRALETEADNYGISLMKKSELDPKGMLDLMQMLQKETKENEQAEFLNTHPVFSKRIDNIKNQIGQGRSSIVEDQALQSLFLKLLDDSDNW